ATRIMVDTARLVEKGGADFILICTNTMHLMAEEVQKGINVPLLHIADATAQAIKRKELNTVGLLGTRYTMEKDFYRGRLEDYHQLKVLIPDEDDREFVHRVIYDELVKGIINQGSREIYRKVITCLVNAGAQGIVLGCTEVGLLVKPEDVPIPIFDTMEIHALAAVDAALGRYPIKK
ncbi:MAG: amino acid racemase, partial [Bacteroidales bacterium]|nr:amino acid racemase [Bacteroidales bacterium]